MCCGRDAPGNGPGARRGLARAVIVLTYAAVLIGGPILVVKLLERGTEKHIVAWAIGLLLVIMTLPLSMADIVKHLLAFKQPRLQKHVVRVLFLPVVFSISSYLCLVFREAALTVETLRDGYEAFAIYSFTAFLLEAAGGEAALAARLRAKPASAGRHIFPMNHCLQPWPLGAVLLRRCKAGVLQYVVVRLVLTAVTLVLEGQGVFAEGELARFDRGYVYVTAIANMSQMTAVYCLLLLLQAAHEELTPVRAWPKLLCVKAVIFFVWWQGIALAVLVQLGLMPTSLGWTEQEVAKGVQNLLIVLEMLPAALAHRWAFPVSDFAPPEREFVAVSTRDDDDDDDARHMQAAGGRTSGGGVGGGVGPLRFATRLGRPRRVRGVEASDTAAMAAAAATFAMSTEVRSQWSPSTGAQDASPSAIFAPLAPVTGGSTMAANRVHLGRR